MVKLNDAWLLKYSLFRNELIFILGSCTSRTSSYSELKENFCDQEVFEVSYPSGKTGPRYVTLSSVPAFGFYDLHDLPDNVICKKLDRKEKLRLFTYYKLDVRYYGEKKN